MARGGQTGRVGRAIRGQYVHGATGATGKGAIDVRPLSAAEQELIRLVGEGVSISVATVQAGVADSTARLVVRQWRAAQGEDSSRRAMGASGG